MDFNCGTAHEYSEYVPWVFFLEEDLQRSSILQETISRNKGLFMIAIPVSSTAMIVASSNQDTENVSGFEYFLGFVLLAPCAAAVISLLVVFIFKKTPPRDPKMTTAGALAIVAWAIPLIAIVFAMIFANDIAHQNAKPKPTHSGSCLCGGPNLDGLGEFFSALFDVLVFLGMAGMSSVITFILSIVAVKLGSSGRRAAPDAAGNKLIMGFSIFSLVWSSLFLIPMLLFLIGLFSKL